MDLKHAYEKCQYDEYAVVRDRVRVRVRVRARVRVRVRDRARARVRVRVRVEARLCEVPVRGVRRTPAAPCPVARTPLPRPTPNAPPRSV